MENSKFIKVIYFDEAFVADFLQIIAGGELKKTSEFISEVQGETETNAKVEVSAGTEKKGLPKLFSMFSGVSFNVGASVSGDISYKRDRIVKNILENTLLADFISILEDDGKKTKNKRNKGIEVFPNLTVRPEVNSFSYLMLIAPYLNMIDGQIQIDGGTPLKIDLAKIEQAIDKGRGFYEFVGMMNGKKIIFRFNRASFRNNYTMSDLPKMKLTYYAIKVGQISIDELEVKKEFEFGTTPLERVDYSAKEGKPVSEDKIDVYDVVLAGVIQV